MEAGIIVLFGIGLLVISIIIGSLFTWKVIDNKKPIGTIRVEKSDSETAPYLFMEIDQGKFDELRTSKVILLRIEYNA